MEVTIMAHTHSTAQRTTTLYDNLRIELLQQREALNHELLFETTPSEEVQPCADVADQASMDQARDATLIARTRIRERIREINLALEVMKRNDYGRCIGCRREIPFSRLRVQPAALFCVECQAMTEGARSLTRPADEKMDYALNDY
jgi:DnaK suppressor protein